MSALAHTARIALLAGLAISTAAHADHPFVLPSNTSFAGDGNMATFDAAASDHVFFFDHRPLPLATIAITRPDGTAATPANPLQQRFRSVFDVRLDAQGTWKIASMQTMIGGTFKLNGEERRVGGRPGGFGGPAGGRPGGDGGPGRPGGDGGRGHAEMAPGGPGGAGDGPRRQPPVPFEAIPAEATDLHLTETLSRTETFVTVGAPTETVFAPTGHGLELQPITHPNALVAGETARLRLLLDGRPAPGIKVTVIPGGDRYRDDVREIDLTSGPDGVVAVRWPAAGMYWFGAEAQDSHPAEAKAQARHMTYAATLEVMTP